MTVQDVTLHRALMLLLFMKPTMPEDQFYAFPQIALVFSPLHVQRKTTGGTDQPRNNESALCTLHTHLSACMLRHGSIGRTNNCPYLTASYMILPCTADPIIPIKGGGGNVLARLGPLHDLLVAQ